MSARAFVAVHLEAPLERVFTTFVDDIGSWWQPNGLFQFRDNATGVLAFEPGPAGRLVERYDDGTEYEIGRIHTWDPHRELGFSWRPESFGPDERTDVTVRFDPTPTGTRVSVEHRGWESIPQRHAARHGFELMLFQQRLAEWWRDLLNGLGVSQSVSGKRSPVATEVHPGRPEP